MKINDEVNICIVDDNKIFALAMKEDIEATFMSIPIKIHSFIKVFTPYVIRY